MRRASNDLGRRALRSALAVWLAAGIAVAAGADAIDPNAEGEARAVVEGTISDILAVLEQADWTIDRRVFEIESIAYDRFDFHTIAKLVLARSYRKFSKVQRETFEHEFKHHLSHSYGSRVDRYEQERVEVLGTRTEKRGDVTVLTRIVGGSADGIELHYRLRKREGRWRMIDVVIEGVSLVSSYRSQFKEAIRHGGPEELLRRIHEKNDSLGCARIDETS